MENQRALKLSLTEIAREDVDWVLLSAVGVRWLTFVSTVMDRGFSFTHRIFFLAAP